MTTVVDRAFEVAAGTHCRGTGKIVRTRRTVTQTDVAEAIGTTRTGVTNFLGGRQGFTMPVTLRLLEWLAAQEPA